jgi:hypothetical protein
MQRSAEAIDLDGDTIKVGLSGTGHVPNIDDVFLDDAGVDDFTDFEATGTGYAGGFAGAGRLTLASKTTTYNTGTNRAIFDAADPTWSAYNPTAVAAQLTVFKEITNDAGSPMVANLEFPDVDPNGNDFVVQFHADGIFYVAA